LMFIPSFLLLFEPTWLAQDPERLLTVILAGALFYIGFTGLEPILPSLVSEAAPGASYGTALGFYNTVQFLGSAVGGPLAGALANFPIDRTLFTMIIAATIGFLMMVATKPPVRSEIERQ